MILHQVFGTFLARPTGLLHFLFLSEWLIHVTSYAGYPKAAPVWAEIRIALAKREILPLAASLGPGKTCILFGLTFGAGNLFFPISYIFGDVLTEVYGYARTRKVIWAGFSAMIFATIMGLFVIHMPGDPEEPFNAVIQPALEGKIVKCCVRRSDQAAIS